MADQEAEAGGRKILRPKSLVRPFTGNTVARKVLPSRRDAAKAFAAVGLVSPFATAKGGRSDLNTSVAAGTPDIIRRTAAASFPTGRLTLTPGTWVAYSIDRPVVLVAANADDIQTASINGAIGLFYNYGSIPFGGSAASSAGLGLCQVSHNGVAVLGSVGTWFLFPQTGFGTQPYVFNVYDAWNPAIVARYINKPGANVTIQSNFTLNSVTAVTNILAPNAGRIAAWIQAVNVSDPATVANTSGRVRISIDRPASYLTTGAAWVPGHGILLTVPGVQNAAGPPSSPAPLILQGDYLAKGSVNAILENATNPTGVEVVEFLDWI